MIIEVRRRGHIQRLTYEDFERRVQEGELDASTPVRFEAVTGDAFVPAGELELVQTLLNPDAVGFRQNLTNPGLPLATALLVGVQIRIYLWSWLPRLSRRMQEQLTDWTPAILERGEGWRLITYGLLHVDFTHLLFNLLFLAYTGYHLERAIGRANLLALFFGSVFTGGLLSMAMSPALPTLGASGGGFGLLAAAVVFGWKHWDAIPESARKYFGFAIAPYPVLSILTSLNAENVDNWCHLGGLLGGAALMTVLEPEVFSQRRRANRRVRFGLYGGMALTLAVLAVWGMRLVPMTRELGPGWSALRPAYWLSGTTFTGDQGWFFPVGEAPSLVLDADEQRRRRPVGEAADELLARVSGSASDTVLVSETPLSVQGAEAVELRFTFSLDEQPMTLNALLASRGIYEQRLQLVVPVAEEDRYAPLWERLKQGLRLSELPELTEARTRASANPRSWEPALRLGEALARNGEPEAALHSLDQAQQLAPERPEVVAARLRVLADYRSPEAAEAARTAALVWPLEPRVLVAAAEALEVSGARDEGVALLEEAWRALPGDRVLRRARAAWGLSTTLPE